MVLGLVKRTRSLLIMPMWLFALGLLGSPTAHSAWPEKPIVLVVSSTPGSLGDVVARLLLDELRAHLGQPIVVENKAGAAGNIGVAAVARADPDGYTFLLGPAYNFVINQFLYKGLPDPLTALEPVAILFDVPLAIFANSSNGQRTFAEFVNFARTNRGKINYASPGSGSSGHIFSEQINRAFDLGMTHVPYKGGHPALGALVANEVQMLLIGAGFAAPQVKAGKLVALAVASPQPMAVLPGTPTFQQTGLGHINAGNWWGVAAPKETPADIRERMSGALTKAVAAEQIQTRLRELAITPVATGPTTMKQRLSDEATYWKTTLPTLKISVN